MSDNSKNSILIVDDQPNNLKVISGVLNDKYNLFVANSGEKALKVLERIKPDLILLDVMMPDMDGYEVCEKVKSNPETSSVPVIFLTAKIDIDDIVKGFEKGAVDYITKPFNVKEVLVRIENHIHLANAKRKIIEQNNQLMEFQTQLLKRNEELLEAKNAIETNAFQMIELNSLLMANEVLLKEKNQELEEINNQKDKFFSIIAHDLKSPFSGLIGLLSIMNDSPELLEENEKAEMIAALFDSTKSLYSLLENLLEWSRIQRKLITPSFDAVCFHCLAKDTIKNLESQSQAKNIKISNIVPHPAIVNADIMMISTVVRNLTSNSIKFTNIGGEIEIGCSDAQDGEFYQFFIKDNGVGMNQKTLNSLFNVGDSKSSLGTAGETGTGLGVVLCKEFIELNNGKIWVESELGKGTTFFFTLKKTY